jgi:hypothetical protein
MKMSGTYSNRCAGNVKALSLLSPRVMGMRRDFGVQVPTVVTMKTTVFCDVTSRIPVVHRRFGKHTASIFGIEE